MKRKKELTKKIRERLDLVVIGEEKVEVESKREWGVRVESERFICCEELD